jgi:hypothetical protein
MRVPREAAHKVLGPLISEVVKQEKRVQLGRVLKAKCTMKMNASALHCRNGLTGF